MTWSLSRNGYGNSYYASAVYAASRSWSAFGLGALDLSGFVSIDKTPLSVWMMAISARIFGFSPLSLLLPNAICGVASVLTLHNVVKRSLGPRTAIVAALALATTPVFVVVSRFDNPDALLVLLLVCAAWTITRAIESGRTRYLVLCGVLIGLAFNTKMLQAYLVLPGLALAFLAAGPGTSRRRLKQLAVAGAAMLIVSFVWVSTMMLIPATHRPWVGDTTANSWWQLIFGANGLARLGTRLAPASPGGSSGLLRLFNIQNGGQIAWLIPLAGLGLAMGLRETQGARRRDPRRAAFLLWGGWAVVHAVTFSVGLNLFHPYYASALAPAVAVLAASALVMLWERLESPLMTALTAATLLCSGALAVLLLSRPRGFAPWLPWIVAGLSILAALACLRLSLRSLRRRGVLAAIAVAAGLTSMFVGPMAFSVATVDRSINGIDPVAGPMPTTPDSEPGRETPERRLLSYLVANRGGSKYLVAVSGSAISAAVSLATRQPVVTMGGFGGTDPAPTVNQLRQLIQRKELRFVLLSAPGVAPAVRGLGGDRPRVRWVRGHCRQLGLGSEIDTAVGDPRGTLYDCAGAA